MNPPIPHHLSHVGDGDRLAFAQSIQDQVVRLTDRLVRGPDSRPPQPAVRGLARRMGGRLVPMGRALADVVQQCGLCFRGTPIQPAALRDRAGRVLALEDAARALEAALKQVRGALQIEQGDLARDVDTGLRVIRATLDNPATPAADRGALSSAAAPLQEMSAAPAHKGHETRRRNQATQATLTEAQAQVQAAQAQARASQASAARLRLEKRYLQGETLHPQDLVALAEEEATLAPTAVGQPP